MRISGRSGATYLSVVLLVAIAAFPFFWMALSSIKISGGVKG
jgi:hypothetical protein